MSSTLIHGDHDAVLVDTLVTFDQVDALADWVQSFGKRLTAIYITHGPLRPGSARAPTGRTALASGS